MDKERLEPNSPQEEAMWRAQVLRRTARICSAKAKELERMAKVDGNTPMRDSGTLKDVLKRIDNVMEWRFVNALGEVVLANEIASRPLEPVSGDWAPWEEIFQWYIVQDPSFIMEHTDEPVFHDEELDLYVWGITHFGTSWDYVPAPEIH